MRANRETDWASRATLPSDPDMLGDLLEISLGRRRVSSLVDRRGWHNPSGPRTPADR